MPSSQLSLGDRAADFVARTVGSWKFIIGQSLFLATWIVINGYLALHRFHFNSWDPYPFILLNLMLSFQAAFTGPILQMTGNRRDTVDAMRTAQTLHNQNLTLDAILVNSKALLSVIEAVRHELASKTEAP